MQRKKVYIDHDPEATFLYVLRLPDIAGSIFDETSEVSAVIEVPVTSGINQLTAQAEWTGNCRTRIKVNGGSLLGATSARLLVKIVHEGVTYTTDPVNIRMVG
ncbi:hypothetical protein ZC03_094 [Pseudomonas phage ZC03]|uniref:Uncharacterized protein n=2 Tax=Zicotriavirus TaxID=2843161 RepID=A0A1L2C987_9CAUD|nr:hypothetical protein HWA93_gp35 [Pseudomonas phage ZC03]YP_009830653.1 hypothetical protein HWA94_gp35 [Pseudomonas phage ZC08]AMD43471.1 hypothetical protein ZC03_094 [Pseudomonas phage ZC03]AMD43474.1 hypothetical protein ZC08_091 [Pseudomonas phage ZC08]